MSTKTRSLLLGALSLLGGAMLSITVTPDARAQYSDMSCGELWYARNAIYARNGYCFKTDRARDTFGRGCFPPYGNLSGGEKRQVSDIKRWEGRKGC